MDSTLPSFSRLIATSLTLFKKHIHVLALISVLPMVFTYAAQSVSEFMYTDSPNALIFVAVSVAFSLIAIIGFVIYPVVIIRAIDIAHRGGEVDLNTLYRQALKDFFPFIYIGIITMLIILGASIFFIVPGIIAAFYLVFRSYSYVLEGKRGVDALTTSAWRIRGNAWTVLTWVAGLALFVFATSIIIMLAVSIVTQVTHTGILAFNFLSNLFSLMLIGPFVSIYVYYMYESLRTVTPSPEIDPNFKKTTEMWFTIVLSVLVLASVFFIVMLPRFKAVLVEAQAQAKARQVRVEFKK